jgi:nucleoid-associated protein YgaU
MENGFIKSILKRIKLSESTISMVLGALVIVIIGALIINYFRGVGSPEEEISTVTEGPFDIELVEEDGQMVPASLPATYEVAQGDHLWAIAERHYGSGYNWVNIAEKNELSNPNQIEVGQELEIPRAAVIQPETAFGAVISGGSYEIAKGDHLWGIAVRAYGDGYRWSEIAQANQLENPNIIVEGNVLKIPR